jgi:1,4-alpha-glucan branching enzyme
VREKIPNPNAEQTFFQSKLDWSSLAREPHNSWLQFYRELLSIRQRKIVPLLKETCQSRIERCDEDKRALTINWSFVNGLVLTLCANLGNADISTNNPGRAEQIYTSNPKASQGFAQGHLPALSVVWTLQN